MTTVSFFVPGKAAPQGSKDIYNGRPVESSKALGPWRESVQTLCRQAAGPGRIYPEGTPVVVVLEFVLPRPKSTPKRSTPPAVKRPDVDKLARACLDAIGFAGTWHDDSQVTHLVSRKRLAQPGEVPGVHVSICPAVVEVAA